MRYTAVAVGALLSVLLIGCSSLLGLREPNVSVSFDAEPAIAADLRLRVDLGGEVLRLVPQGDERSTSVKTHAPRYGRVPVHIVLLRASGDTLARAEFTQEFRKGENHWVAALLARHRPMGHCIGDLEVVPLRAPLSAAAADTLFVVHGSIPEGAIC